MLPDEAGGISGVKNAHPVCRNSELVLVGKLGAGIVQKLERLNLNRPEFPDRNADTFWSEKRVELDCGNVRADSQEIHFHEHGQAVASMLICG